MAQWRHRVTQSWVNIASGNGFLPDGTKPLSEPRMTNHKWGLHLRTISQKTVKISALDMSLKITDSKELRSSPYIWDTEQNPSLYINLEVEVSQ